MEPLPEDWSRALCVVAHPDDLEYGMASASPSGPRPARTSSYLLVTRGEHGIDGMAPDECARVREAEERASARVVGVDTVEFLDGHTDGLSSTASPLRRDLAVAIRRHRPEVVLSINFRESWGGRSFNMADHRNVGWALLDAARDAGNRWLFPDVLDGPSRGTACGSSRSRAHRRARTTSTSAPTSTTASRACASTRRYIEGLGDPDFDPDAFLRGFASAAGEQAGCEHAVPFEVFEL